MPVNSTRRQEYRVPSAAPPISHYTDAVGFGDLVFVSGCAGVDGLGLLVEGGIIAQAKQAFKNLAHALEAAGCSFRDVLKVTVYMTDVDDRRLVNPIRQGYFGESRPASTLVEVSKLAMDEACFEIEAIAARGSGDQRATAPESVG
jgi:reactive intermediate/imine deaminase